MTVALDIDPETGARLIVLAGRLDSASATTTDKTLAGMDIAPDARVLVDLTGMEYMSSAGLRLILLVARRVQQARGKVAVFGMQDHIRQLFEISGLLSVLTVTPDLTTARAAIA